MKRATRLNFCSASMLACDSLTDEAAVDCIDRIEQSKKAGRPMALTLRPNFDLLAQLKTLHMLFLDDNGMVVLLLGTSVKLANL